MRDTRSSNRRDLFYTCASQSTALPAVHSVGFSESDAHAFNRLLVRVGASFQGVGASGASLD
jgi:hypothetical protein